MMNSYFDHSSAGFYNPAHQAAAAEAHQAAYRSFSQGLTLVPSASSSAYQGSRTNSAATPTDSTSNYVDAACKLYDGTSVSGQSSAFKAECGLSKDQNGFKAPDQMTATSSWNSALRPSPSSASMSDPMRSFDAAAAAACSRSVTDAWSACCNTSTGAPTVPGLPPGGNFYPWMAIAGKCHLYHCVSFVGTFYDLSALLISLTKAAAHFYWNDLLSLPTSYQLSSH